MVLVDQVLGRRRQRHAFTELPLIDSYQRALGGKVQFFEDWMEHSSPADPYWDRADHSVALETVGVPVLVQAGWYDIFVAQSIVQYEALRDRGKLLAVESLASDANAVRVSKAGSARAQVLDGPFAEAKEMIGGFFLLDCASMEEAVAIAHECPAAEWATVEVRALGPCFA